MTSPDITEVMPVPLGTTSSVAAVADDRFDVSFNGLGFNLRPSKENPYQRGTEQSRKQQLDVSESPGEQSLSSWWTRSQDTWDMGAGIKWYEPGTEPETYKRFANSQGVDVWTPGELKLLNETLRWKTGAVQYNGAARMIVNGVDGVVASESTASDGVVYWYSDNYSTSDPDSWETDGTAGVTGLSKPAVLGEYAWIGGESAIVRFQPNSASAWTETLWTCTGAAQVWAVKARLIVAIGPSLYEIPATPPAGSPTVENDGTHLYTHHDPTWQWLSVDEAGAAILAAGAGRNSSAVFRLTLEQDELNQPVLSAPQQVAVMPASELITSMGIHLGAYMVLGTTKGVRVGVVNDQGSVQYGPITIPLATGPNDICFDDRFAYVGVSAGLPDGNSGLARIDLSSPVGDTGRYAWAWDLTIDETAPVIGVAITGTGAHILTASSWYAEVLDSPKLDGGWVDTGRIRFGTSEPKAFRLARMVCKTNGGNIRLDAITSSDTEVRVVEFSNAYNTAEQVAIQIPGSVQTHQYLSFKITITPAPTYPDYPNSPVVNGLAIKAVPAAARVRLFQYPLSIFDHEDNRFGLPLAPGSGNAYQRLRELERLEETGAPVTVKDRRTGETYIGQIDTVDFTDPHPPDGHESGFGGVATVVVRRLS